MARTARGPVRFRGLVPAMIAAAAGLSTAAQAQLRITEWNVSNYSSGRVSEFQTSIYGQFQGRSMSPDIMICQEFISASAVAAFLSILNTAAGSPGDWAAAPFINGNDSDNAFFYRTSRAQFLGATVVMVGSSSTELPPRDVVRYDVRPFGYAGAGATLSCYSSHMKSGSSANDLQQRLIEATAIRSDAGVLPAGWNFLLAGDFNIPNSSQAAFQQLVGDLSGAPGRFYDPISTPGAWQNNQAFQFVHTQAPGGTDPQQTGGMDDRFDLILLSASLVNGQGFSYIGNPAVPYSTTTWNDPNHSYRAWGNDGTSFNQILTTTGNTMVGAAIAQALRASTGPDASGGHLPVYLDLRVPARVASVATIDFGSVVHSTVAQMPLVVSNGGDVARWNAAGIASLSYSLSGSAGITVPAGSFVAPAGVPGNSHTIMISTASLGPVNGTVTITSSDPDQPQRVVQVTGEIIAGCYPNCDNSTIPPVLNVNDFFCFLNRYAQGDSYANCDNSTIPPVLNISDFLCFVNVYAGGCP